MKSIVAVSVLVLFLSLAWGSGDAQNNVKIYPKAEAGMVRHVLILPQEQDEYSCKVELIAGKTVMANSVNSQFFVGGIKPDVVQGFQYPFYVVDLKEDKMGSTLVGGGHPVEKFITLGGEPYLVHYNSRLPLVVYAPEGVEVRYRVWKAQPQQKPLPQG
jgi:ecotin